MELKSKEPDLCQIMQQVHENAVQHGWWESKPSDEHCLMLVVCELAEAVEADRQGMRADLEAFEKYIDRVSFEENFERHIKDTVDDELADTVIRLLDLAGALHCDLLDGRQIVGCIHNSRAFTENVWEIVQVLANRQHPVKQRILSGIVAVEILATSYDINLWWHVEQKMRYNTGRPYKHGKRY